MKKEVSGLIVGTREKCFHKPGPPLISYRARSDTLGLSLRSRERGCPIPPAAPRTVTLESCDVVSNLTPQLELRPR